MVTQWKKMILVAGLLGAAITVSAEENPFTMDKMLSDPDVMPAVNTCLSKHKPTGQAFVQSIMPMNHGLVNIVTGDTEGRRMECIAELRSGKFKEQAPVVDAKGPLFVSAAGRRKAPAGECFTAKAVKSGSKQQGWLLTQNGKCGGISWQGIGGKTR